METSYLKLLSPLETLESTYYNKIINYKPKILGPKIYYLDWTFIFSQIDKWKKINNSPLILDVGCGNSMFHPFLESYFYQGIIGLDRNNSSKDYEHLKNNNHVMVNITDICCDFIDEGEELFKDKIDIIFWNSAIEHNSLDKMKQAINVSMKCLKKGGAFISTWAYGKKTFWNKDINATILSENDAKELFNIDWVSKPNFEAICKEYQDNYLSINDWHINRFGNNNINYLHAGSVIIK